MKFVTIVVSIILFLSLYLIPVYSQQKSLEDELAEKVISQVKAFATNRNLENIALWRIEVDDKGSINVIDLTTRINFGLIDEGVLRNQRVNLYDTTDLTELERITKLYGLSVYGYGRRTTVEGERVSLTLELVDVDTQEVIWQDIIRAGEEFINWFAVGKWSTLSVGGAAGIGALASYLFAVDTFENRYLKSTDPTQAEILIGEVDTFNTLAIVLGVVGGVSASASVYFFVADPIEGLFAQTPYESQEEGISVLAKGDEIILSGSFKF